MDDENPFCLDIVFLSKAGLEIRAGPPFLSGVLSRSMNWRGKLFRSPWRRIPPVVVLGEVLLLHLTPVVDPSVSVGDMAVLAYQIGKQTVSFGGVLSCGSGDRYEHHGFLVQLEMFSDDLRRHFRRQDGCGPVPVLEVDDELADHHLLRGQLHHALQLAGVVVQDAYFLDVFVVVDFFHGGTSDMQR